MRDLHDNLVEAGQALPASEIKTFILSISDDKGKMIAGCKGEIAFNSAHISELWVAETGWHTVCCRNPQILLTLDSGDRQLERHDLTR